MKFLVAFLVLPAAALLAWGVISLVLRERRRHLHEALAPYSVGTVSDAGAALGQGGGGQVGVRRDPVHAARRRRCWPRWPRGEASCRS